MTVIDFVEIKSNRILERSKQIAEIRELYGDPNGLIDKELRELNWNLHLMQLQEQENRINNLLEQHSCDKQDSGGRVSPHETLSPPFTPPIFVNENMYAEPTESIKEELLDWLTFWIMATSIFGNLVLVLVYMVLEFLT